MNQKTPATSNATPPSDKSSTKDDGPLDSLGKAITDPIKSAAEEEDKELTAGKPARPSKGDAARSA